MKTYRLFIVWVYHACANRLTGIFLLILDLHSDQFDGIIFRVIYALHTYILTILLKRSALLCTTNEFSVIRCCFNRNLTSDIAPNQDYE